MSNDKNKNQSNKMVSLTIDGKKIQAPEGANLIQVARDNGIDIPGLCYHSRVSPTGACRLCITKIKGVPGMPASCTVSVKEGMEVSAFDKEVETLRKSILDLLLSEHNEADDGSYDDEFKELLGRYGLDKKENREFQPLWQDMNYPLDLSSPVLDYDGTKCITCFRCIKGCDELQGKRVLSVASRGISSFIVAGFKEWSGSECDGCGECVQLCPTGALVEKTLTEKVQMDKIDRKVKTTCTYCGVGCQMDLWIQNEKVVRATGHEVMPNMGRMCIKGRFGYEFIHSEHRLTKPMIRKNGELVETTLEEAFDTIAEKFTEIKAKYGGRAFGGYASAKCTNEENYVFQKFFRAVLNTNSVEHCARLCHAATVTALMQTIGSGAMGNSIQEFEHADCIIAIGTNPIDTHPVTATYVKRGHKKGTKIIVIDPRRNGLVKYATLWLKQKTGSDVALVNGIINVIIKEGLYKEDFITSRLEGGMESFNQLKEAVSKYTPEKTEELTGVPAADIIATARIYGKAEKASVITGMGMSQSTHGTDNVTALINLALITGNFGRESTGINPLRGQNNVQGASDMGGICNVYPGYQPVADENNRRKFADAWGVPVDDLDPEPGLSSVDIVNAAHEGKIKALYIMGENPLLTDPNMKHTQEAFEKLEFMVVQDIFLTDTAQMADVVLPAACFAEKDGTFSNTDRHVLRVRKALDTPGDCMEDWKIVSEISKRMGYEMNFKDASDIMDEIARVTPSYGGISYERLEKEDLQWPCPTPDHKGTQFLHTENFPSGLGRLIPVEHQPLKIPPDMKYPFILNTGRTLYQYHTSTMSNKSKPLNTFLSDPFMEMNPVDVEALDLSDGELVRVISRQGKLEVKVRKTDLVGKGEIFMPFHFSEVPVNRLTSAELDPKARIPGFKQTPCRVEKI
jgi:formate dehydrogenase alpha subunit